MKGKRITIQLVGSSDDKADVRLADFIQQLTYVKNALFEAELAISGAAKPTIDYKVVDLRHNSPATVVLEPVSSNGQLEMPDLLAAVPVDFTKELRTIRRDAKLIHRPEIARLQAYQKIGTAKQGKKAPRVEKVSIRQGRNVVTIDEKFRSNLDSIMGPDETVEGSVSGMLEVINFHNTNRFTLYPELGPKSVTGTFPPKLRPRVKEAIGSFVTIYGKLKYKAWSDLPHAVVATEIDIHEPDSELPSLLELRGAFEGITGELNSAEYMDKLRSENW